jgi:hypothetical protein
VSSSRGLRILGPMRALVLPSGSILVSLPLCLKLKNFIIYVSLCNSRIHVITLFSGHVCVYYASMLRCWHHVWILVRANHPCLGVGCHTFPKVWGCEAYVKHLMSDKLTLKSDKSFFVGYPRETKGYYFDNKAEGKVFATRNGVFMEKEFLSKGVSRSMVQLEEIQETPKIVSAPTDPIHEVQDIVLPDVEVPAPRRSIRARCASKKSTLLTTKHRGYCTARC